MNGNELELSLIETLRKANLSELGADLTDKALEAAGGIPIVGVLQKFWSVACSVPTYLFMKKMIRFLAELKDISPEERRAQIAKLEIVPGETERVGETLLLLIDRLNDMQKPTMVGRAFKAYLEGTITREQFHSLSHAIDTLSLSHFEALERFCNERSTSPWIGPTIRTGPPILGPRYPSTEERERNLPFQALAMCGLVSIDWRAETRPTKLANLDGGYETSPDEVVGGQIAYAPSPLGYLFCEVVLNRS
jgi:hypothetical protein